LSMSSGGVRNFEGAFLLERWGTTHRRNTCLQTPRGRGRVVSSKRTEIGLKQVASATGFGNVDTDENAAFVRLVGDPPPRPVLSRASRTHSTGK